MNNDECPNCGSEDYHFVSGWINGEPIDPDEGWCDKCGFRYREHIGHPEDEQVRKFRKSHKLKR